MQIQTVSESKDFYENSKKFPYLTVLLKIPESLWLPIVAVQEELQRIDPRQQDRPPSYFHITLKEIGGLGSTVNETDLPRIKKAIEKVASSNRSFRLDFGPLAIFPSVVYLSVRNKIDEIRKIHLDLIRKLGDLAIKGPFEGPEMIPHVTLLEFVTTDVEPLLRYVRVTDLVDGLSMEVDKLTLVKSYSYRLFSTSEERDHVNEDIASFDPGIKIARFGEPNA